MRQNATMIKPTLHKYSVMFQGPQHPFPQEALKGCRYLQKRSLRKKARAAAEIIQRARLDTRKQVK